MMPLIPSPTFLKALLVDPPHTEAEKIIATAIPAMINEYSIEVAADMLLKKREKSHGNIGNFGLGLLAFPRYEEIIV